MYPNRNLDIVLEGALEARVVSQTLLDAGRLGLAASITPSPEPATISEAEFGQKFRADELQGNSDPALYTLTGSTAATAILTEAATMNVDSQGRPRNMSDYLGQKLLQFFSRLDEMPDEQPVVDAIGEGFVILDVSEDELSLILRRKAFTEQYFAERGLTMDTVTLEQIIEMHQDPHWQNPPELE